MAPDGDSLHWTASFLIAASIGLAAIPVARELGRRRLVDREARDRHGRRVPRSGGVGVAVAWAAGLVLVGGVHGTTAALVGLAAFALVVGLHDDRFDSSPRWRLAVLGALALNAAAFGLQADVVALPGGAVVELGIFAVPLSALWIVGATVAFDFIDGLDGLAAGLTVVTAGAVAVLAAPGDLALAAGALAGAAGASFVLHRPPATVHLGDNGSNFVGFVCGCLTLTAVRTPAGDAFPAVVGLLLIAVPVLDAALAMTRRSRAPDLFAGDRDHLHHRLADRHGTGRALTLMLGSGAACAAAAVAPGKWPLGLLVLGALLYEVTQPRR